MFCSIIFVMLMAVYCARSCNVTSKLSSTGGHCSYLDIAIDLIEKAIENMPTCCDCPENDAPVKPEQKPVDCADLLEMGHNKSGVHQIWPVKEGEPLKVYCDMDTDGGGWTVIQRRGNYKNPKDYFSKNWARYKEGFGDKEKEFWLGNDNIFALTHQKPYSVRFDLMDVKKEKKYAHYEKFEIGDEEHNYILSISDYSGDADDSMIPNNDRMFSTKDRDNRRSSPDCKRHYEGGWWYLPCHHGGLNGFYLKGKHPSFADGVIWSSWKGDYESLEWTEIKIRPSKSIAAI